MHFLNVATVAVLFLLVGAEFSVSAFVNPSAWRLEAEAQVTMLSRFAYVLGRAMPLWYAAGMILLAVETWLHRQNPGIHLLVAASLLWLLATLGSIFFLVPLNNRVVAGAPGWQEAHHSWDSRHRVRIVLLAGASLCFAFVIVR